MTVLLGAIADDFTGATDLANTLVQQGMRVVQVIGVPHADLDIGDVDAVVVALKSRMAPADEAVSWSLHALAWLKAQDVQQFFFKYCSTFDSTTKGNIGPVGDALVNAVANSISVICPAFPDNGRTIYKGNLFVGELPLSESSMRDHPLTPMRDSNLMRLMSAQSNLKVANINLETVRAGPTEIKQKMTELEAVGHAYCVTDAIFNEDLDAIGKAIQNHKLVTGGSAIARGLPANFREKNLLGNPLEPSLPQLPGRSLVLAGSCSVATRSQIAYVSEKWPCLKLDVDALVEGTQDAATVLDWAATQSDEAPLLIYASADPAEVAEMQDKYGVERAGQLVEKTIGDVASSLVTSGITKIVVAGGETSGAVVEALDIKALRIGPEIDPGVPWTESVGVQPVALALKSGNFGSEDFFVKALDMLP
ncbi:MAG: four-carbon acid sugar kinase family protein [Proteobacteria bacterium]|nr:four-carbon acid sugar kinase family protein [Pseudomonadota bacterium]